jgi:alpha,alpha-trehalase
MRYPFLVPGGRFLEFYYWDSYWILEGLLVSGMFETSKEIILNQMLMIQKYGYIPNGSRVYYLNRSQPPYFSLMVFAFYEALLKTDELSDAEKKRKILLKIFKFLNFFCTTDFKLKKKSTHDSF